MIGGEKQVNKTVLIIVAVAAISIGGYFLFSRGYQAPEVGRSSSEIVIPTESATIPATEKDEAISEPTEQGVSKINITSGNFFFRPSSVSVDKGEVTVTVEENAGTHTFVIDDLGVKESLLSGTSFTFTADIPGSYQYYCDVPGHKEQGMLGSLQVK